MKLFLQKPDQSTKTRIRTLSHANKKNESALKQKILSTQGVKVNKNSLPKQKGSAPSFILSLLMQDHKNSSCQKQFPFVNTSIAQKPRLTLKCRQIPLQRPQSQLRFQANWNKKEIAKIKLSPIEEKLEYQIREKLMMELGNSSKAGQNKSETQKSEIESFQTIENRKQQIKKSVNGFSAIETIENKYSQQNGQSISANICCISRAYPIPISANNHYKQKFHKLYEGFQIHNQFSIFINATSQSSKKSTSTQTMFDDNEDIIFYQEFCKYRYIKSKIYEEVQHKKQTINQFKKESIEFKKHYHDLINPTSGQQPQNDREKRVFQLSKQLEAAQDQMNQISKQITNLNTSFQQDLIHKMPLVESKQQTSRLLIFHQLNCLIDENSNNHKSETQKQLSSQSSLKQKLILQKVLNQIDNLKSIDKSFKTYVSKTFELCREKLTEFEKAYKNWSNLYYEKRVLLYNFIKHIQKMPALMTQLFGCGNPDTQDQSSYQNQRENLLKEFLSSKCDQCYHFKTKITYLQQSNLEIKPIFKALQWLIRESSKKQSCIQLI